jgi:hypothetical protein
MDVVLQRRNQLIAEDPAAEAAIPLRKNSAIKTLVKNIKAWYATKFVI